MVGTFSTKVTKGYCWDTDQCLLGYWSVFGIKHWSNFLAPGSNSALNESFSCSLFFFLFFFFLLKNPFSSLLSHLSILPHLMYLTSGFLGCQFFKTSDLQILVLPLSFYCLLYPLFFLFFSLVYKSAFFFLSWRNGILSNLYKVTHQWLIKGLALRLLSPGEPRLMASLNCYPTFIPNPELFLLKSIYHDFFFLFQAE